MAPDLRIPDVPARRDSPLTRCERWRPRSAATCNDPRYLANQDDSGSELIVPVVRAGRVVGTLDVESNELGAFGSATIAHHQRCAEALKAVGRASRRAEGS